MPELKDVYAFLEAKNEDGTPKLANGSELSTVLKAEFKKRNDEAASHRTKGNAFEEQLKKVKASLEIGDEDDLDGALDKLKTMKKGATAGESEAVTKLQKQLEKMQTQLKAADEKTAAEAQKRKHETMLNKTMAALNDKVVRPGDIVKLALENVSMSDDGKIIFKHGDEELPLEEGIGKWLGERPEFVKNSQSSGAGSSGAAAGLGGAIDLSKAKSQKEYEEMRRKQKGK